MRSAGQGPLTWAALAFGVTIAAPAIAGDAVMLGGNPSECEVAAALGINKPGCPPLPRLEAPVRILGGRGLTIGTTGPAPEPPPMEPVHAATTPAAPPAPVAVAAPMPTPAAVIPVVSPAPAPVVRPEAPPPLHHEYTAAFQINFEFGSARLTDDARHVLDLVGTAITAPDAAASRFRIVGHTDAAGPHATNQKLSEDRAGAVKAYLITRYGLAPARLESMGRGSREPFNRANPRAPENRRVEITNLRE